MITNFFNKTKPINFLVLSCMMFVVYLISSIFVFSGDLSLNNFIKKSFYLLLVVFMLFVLDFVIRKNALTKDNSYALWFYILLCGFYPYSFENTQMLIANFFLLLSFRKIYSLRTPFNTKEKIFDSSLWISIASIFYDWSFVYLILVYCAIFLFNKSSRSNLIIPVIGFITPVFMLYVYLLTVDKLNIFGDFWKLDFSFDVNHYLLVENIYPILLIIIFTLVSIFSTTKKSLLSSQDFKATWIVLIFQTGLSFIMVLIAPLKNGSELSFLFFPLCILFANYFQDIQKYWLKEVFLYLFLLLYFSVYMV